MSNQKLSPLFQLRNHIIDFWRSDKKNFLGRVLTIVDASIADPEQRKGIKDLIQDAFYSDHRYLEDSAREVIFEFANKFCKDQIPKTDSDKDAFRGIVSDNETEKVVPGYFN